MNLYASSGKIDITPCKKIPLFGFSLNRRNGVCDGVDSSLEVNVVIFKYNEEYTIFISADTLYITDEIKSSIAGEININEDRVLFGASHTHYAPSVDHNKPLLGPLDKGYQSFFIDKVIHLIKDILEQEFVPIHIFYRKELAPYAVVRRKKVWKKIIRFPNKKAYNDPTLYVLTGKGEKTEFIIWSWACHPVEFGKRNRVNAAYPGKVREYIRLQYPGIPVLFFQGFCGDVNPFILDKKITIRNMMLRLFNKGLPFGKFTDAEYKKWCSSLSKIILKLGDEIKPCFKHSLLKMPLSDFVCGDNPHIVSFQKIELNPRLSIMAISAEVEIYYTKILRRLDQDIIPIGFVNSVFGYFPAQDSINKNTYEGGGFFESFGINGYFKDGIERKYEKIVHGFFGLKPEVQDGQEYQDNTALRH